MKQFLHKLRNVCAVICAGIVFLFFLSELILLLKIFVEHFSAETAFETIMIVCGINFLTLLFVALGSWLYSTDNDTKADLLGSCGFCEMVSFGILGFLLLAFGVFAHHFLMALGLLFVCIYTGIGIFLATSYITYKLRRLPLTYDRNEVKPSKSGETVLSV